MTGPPSIRPFAWWSLRAKDASSFKRGGNTLDIAYLILFINWIVSLLEILDEFVTVVNLLNGDCKSLEKALEITLGLILFCIRDEPVLFDSLQKSSQELRRVLRWILYILSRKRFGEVLTLTPFKIILVFRQKWSLIDNWLLQDLVCIEWHANLWNRRFVGKIYLIEFLIDVYLTFVLFYVYTISFLHHF